MKSALTFYFNLQQDHDLEALIHDLHILYFCLFPVLLLAYLLLIWKVRNTKVDTISIVLLAFYFIVMLIKFLWSLKVLEQQKSIRIDFIMSYISKTLIFIALSAFIFGDAKSQIANLISQSHSIFRPSNSLEKMEVYIALIISLS